MFALKIILRFLLTILILGLLGLGVHDYMKNMDSNECTMTYMYQAPAVIQVHLPEKIKARYPDYKLYFYCEGYDCQNYESLRFTTPGHIPVLFVTGNADSHMQVRSFASVGLDKSRKNKYLKKNIKFQYFTISFNEELSAAYGPLLEMQTKFTKYCIEHILQLFEGVKPESKRPKSVLIIGNSMGGVIARSILVPLHPNDDFHKKNLVHTIITQATPHIRPVVKIDKKISDHFILVNNFWLNKSESSLNNIVLVSLYGGSRDILIRSGLANINDWTDKTPATVISSNTMSVPYVWRSIDHHCMTWCKELVLVVNRAFFDLIDPQTGQLNENKQIREKILRHYFQRDINKPNIIANNNNKIIKATNLEMINEKSKMNYKFNDFNTETRLVAFSLKDLINKQIHDSLFIYTNLKSAESFLLCKNFNRLNDNDEHECIDSNDLFIDYGRSIPFLYENNRKESTFRTININNLIEQIETNKYTHLLINIPIWLKKSTKHQIIIKFDWYLRKDRINRLELPSIFDNTKTIEIDSTKSAKIFSRYYLPTLNNVLQAFTLNKYPSSESSSCDKYLIEHLTNKKMYEQKPLESSTLMVQFYDQLSRNQVELFNEEIYNSQGMQKNDRNILLRLQKNRESNQDESLVPYIDILNFDTEHLLHYTSIDEINKNENLLAKCLNQHKIKIEISYVAVLGQFVRFFIFFMVPFVPVVVQFYDFIILSVKAKIGINQNLSDDEFKSYFILNKFQICFGNHFIFSILISVLINLLNQLKSLFNQIDESRSFLLINDFEFLDGENLYCFITPFVLYWIAYAIISSATLFLTILFNVCSFLFNKILLKTFGFLNYSLTQRLLGCFHICLTGLGCFFSSELVHCSLFYAEMARLASINPNYKKIINNNDGINLRFCFDQTRLLLNYCLLILNLPSLIVWANSTKTGQIHPLNELIGDCGIGVALLALSIHLFNFLKRQFRVFHSLKLNDKFLSTAILINCLFAILYSSVNIYRVQYFILVHLILMSFYSLKPSTVYEQKSKDD